MSSAPQHTFSFPYSISYSDRARRVSVKLCPYKGVRLVVPAAMPMSAAMTFLQQHSAWVERHASIWQPALRGAELPTQIDLPALSQSWSVHYDANPLHKRARIIETDNSLTYCGTDEPAQQRAQLQQWLHRKAVQYLTPRLQHWSEQTGLVHSDVSFGRSKTLWGTCRHDKHIRLNTRLLCVAPQLVDYVLIHELAHTQHLNHSAKFWHLVARWYPQHVEARQQLKHAQKNIPTWTYT